MMMMMINVALIIIKRNLLWSFYSRKREHFFSFRGSPLLNYIQGFLQTLNRMCALSFFLFWKNRGLLDTLTHYYNRESSSNAMKTTTTTTTTSVTSRASLLPSQSSSSNEQKRVVARKLKVTLLFLLCFCCCVHITSLSFEFPLAKNSLDGFSRVEQYH